MCEMCDQKLVETSFMCTYRMHRTKKPEYAQMKRRTAARSLLSQRTPVQSIHFSSTEIWSDEIRDVNAPLLCLSTGQYHRLRRFVTSWRHSNRSSTRNETTR